MPAVDFQCVRHAADTALAQAAVPLKTLQALLGHAAHGPAADVSRRRASRTEDRRAPYGFSAVWAKRGTIAREKTAKTRTRKKKKAL